MQIPSVRRGKDLDVLPLLNSAIQDRCFHPSVCDMFAEGSAGETIDGENRSCNFFSVNRISPLRPIVSRSVFFNVPNLFHDTREYRTRLSVTV